MKRPKTPIRNNPVIFLDKSKVHENCPICGGNSRKGVSRRWWMWTIPGSRNYYCESCNKEFMLVFGKFVGWVE